MDCREILQELVEAAYPFTDPDVVDETNGTIPLMERLDLAIEKAIELLNDESGSAAKE